jgi:hypothetical protein
MLDLEDISIDYGLNETELLLAEELLPEFYNYETVGPRPVIRDWSHDFRVDMNSGNGFIVKSKPFKKKIKDKDANVMTRGIKEMDGIHSPRFGTDWLDDNAFADRYSCKCGHLIGRVFENRKCPECGTRVRYVDVNLKIFAYIVINNPEFAIIHPLMYKKLDAYLGKVNRVSVLPSIIEYKMEMGLDGYYEAPSDVDLSKNPYYGIGMYEFVKRFDEIMDFFKKKRKNKQKQYERIMLERDKIFVTKIPIYSAVLRDVFFTNEEYSYTKIDKCYNALYGNVTHINEETSVGNYNIAKLNKNLFRAQKNLNSAWDLIFTSIHENEGLIRRNILGGRMNFSSRCVIVPDSSLRSYEISIPYVCMAELYKPDIINLLVKLDGISYNKAVDRWFDAYREFDPKIYSIMQYIIKNSAEGSRCLLNRNP